MIGRRACYSQERSHHKATSQPASFLLCRDLAGFFRTCDVWVLPRHHGGEGDIVDRTSQEESVGFLLG